MQRGGQVGHIGTTLKQFEEVDEVMELKVDRRSLPAGKLTHAGMRNGRWLGDFKPPAAAEVKSLGGERVGKRRGNDRVG